MIRKKEMNCVLVVFTKKRWKCNLNQLLMNRDGINDIHLKKKQIKGIAPDAHGHSLWLGGTWRCKTWQLILIF